MDIGNISISWLFIFHFSVIIAVVLEVNPEHKSFHLFTTKSSFEPSLKILEYLYAPYTLLYTLGKNFLVTCLRNLKLWSELCSQLW